MKLCELLTLSETARRANSECGVIAVNTWKPAIQMHAKGFRQMFSGNGFLYSTVKSGEDYYLKIKVGGVEFYALCNRNELTKAELEDAEF